MKAKLVDNSYVCSYGMVSTIELYTKQHWWNNWVFKGSSNTVAGALLLLSTEASQLYHITVDKYILKELYAK